MKSSKLLCILKKNTVDKINKNDKKKQTEKDYKSGTVDESEKKDSRTTSKSECYFWSRLVTH